MASFMVRDWMASNFRTGPRREPEPADTILDTVRLALQDATDKARADFPKVFVRADRISRDPRRVPKVVQAFNYTGRVNQCDWCGYDFPARRATDRFCRRECRDAFQEARKESA